MLNVPLALKIKGWFGLEVLFHINYFHLKHQEVITNMQRLHMRVLEVVPIIQLGRTVGMGRMAIHLVGGPKLI